MLVGATVLLREFGSSVFFALLSFFFLNLSVKLELTGPRVSVQIKELEPLGVSDQCGVALCYVVAAAAAWEALPSASLLCSWTVRFYYGYGKHC